MEKKYSKINKIVSHPIEWISKTRLKNVNNITYFELNLEPLLYEIAKEEELNNKSILIMYYILICWVIRGIIDEGLMLENECRSDGTPLEQLFIEEIDSILQICKLPLLPDNYSIDSIRTLHEIITDTLYNMLTHEIQDANYRYFSNPEMLILRKKITNKTIVNCSVTFNPELDIPNISGLFCLIEKGE